MIVTNIVGGLGNQMFQYAAGRRLALHRGTSLKLDLSVMAGYTVHGYALRDFRVVAEDAGPADLPAPPRRGLMGKIDRLLGTGPKGPRRVAEKAYTFDPEILELSDDVLLVGYWQSARYFDDVADTIRSDFSLAEPLSPRGAALAAEIAGTTAVSVHVRRGDYVTNPEANAFHGTCSPDWYTAAMARMVEIWGDPTFFVFSDDPAWARENLSATRPMVFVEPQTGGRDAEDMMLMASCRGHVIANSSFSWWGAWLDPRDDKRVIAPSRWFRAEGMDTRDLIPQSWERL